MDVREYVPEQYLGGEYTVLLYVPNKVQKSSELEVAIIKSSGMKSSTISLMQQQFGAVYLRLESVTEQLCSHAKSYVQKHPQPHKTLDFFVYLQSTK
jgi:hypothetical protein